MFSSNTSQVSDATFIEDVFSTWLYTGTGTTQTITNGIDLAGRGGLVWVKSRSAATDHELSDTVRLGRRFISSNTTAAESAAGGIGSFYSNGFDVLGAFPARVNVNGSTYVSWTFREQPRFFDIVTYTGNGANRTIAHSLGSVPGCIMVKRLDATADWQVYHRSLANTQYMVLNSTAAAATGATRWNSTTPTDAVFSLGTDATVNANGGTYVAYLFAHDAGGFGVTGADNAISCGSFTSNGSAQTINLGYEAQWVLTKPTGATGNWYLFDSIRGMAVTNDQYLVPNTASSEGTDSPAWISAAATGFIVQSGFIPNANHIYIAIRRGPMRTPTSGTSVFSPIASSAATGTTLTTGFPVDAQIFNLRTGTTNKGQTVDRLRGISSTTTESGTQLITNSTAAETTGNIPTRLWDNTSFQMPSSYGGASMVFWNFRRAPGFFDVVCYTGNGTNPRNITHNLGVPPEFMIVKRRGPSTQNWLVYHSAIGAAAGLNLNLINAAQNPAFFWNATPTATQFSTQLIPNSTSENYVAYLFASCPGVSQVGSYTGTGATQVINCGFAAGARFVLIKRTDASGDWYVWDSARGIVAGNDPYLLLNSTAAEVTTTDWVDTAASGFELSNAAGNLVNTNGASYIFLSVS